MTVHKNMAATDGRGNSLHGRANQTGDHTDDSVDRGSNQLRLFVMSSSICNNKIDDHDSGLVSFHHPGRVSTGTVQKVLNKLGTAEASNDELDLKARSRSLPRALAQGDKRTSTKTISNGIKGPAKPSAYSTKPSRPSLSQQARLNPMAITPQQFIMPIKSDQLKRTESPLSRPRTVKLRDREDMSMTANNQQQPMPRSGFVNVDGSKCRNVARQMEQTSSEPRHPIKQVNKKSFLPVKTGSPAGQTRPSRGPPGSSTQLALQVGCPDTSAVPVKFPQRNGTCSKLKQKLLEHSNVEAASQIPARSKHHVGTTPSKIKQQFEVIPSSGATKSPLKSSPTSGARQTISRFQNQNQNQWNNGQAYPRQGSTKARRSASCSRVTNQRQGPQDQQSNCYLQHRLPRTRQTCNQMKERLQNHLDSADQVIVKQSEPPSYSRRPQRSASCTKLREQFETFQQPKRYNHESEYTSSSRSPATAIQTGTCSTVKEQITNLLNNSSNAGAVPERRPAMRPRRSSSCSRLKEHFETNAFVVEDQSVLSYQPKVLNKDIVRNRLFQMESPRGESREDLSEQAFPNVSLLLDYFSRISRDKSRDQEEDRLPGSGRLLSENSGRCSSLRHVMEDKIHRLKSNGGVITPAPRGLRTSSSVSNMRDAFDFALSQEDGTRGQDQQYFEPKKLRHCSSMANLLARFDEGDGQRDFHRGQMGQPRRLQPSSSFSSIINRLEHHGFDRQNSLEKQHIQSELEHLRKRRNSISFDPLEVKDEDELMRQEILQSELQAVRALRQGIDKRKMFDRGMMSSQDDRDQSHKIQVELQALRSRGRQPSYDATAISTAGENNEERKRINAELEALRAHGVTYLKSPHSDPDSPTDEQVRIRLELAALREGRRVPDPIAGDQIGAELEALRRMGMSILGQLTDDTQKSEYQLAIERELEALHDVYRQVHGDHNRHHTLVRELAALRDTCNAQLDQIHRDEDRQARYQELECLRRDRNLAGLREALWKTLTADSGDPRTTKQNDLELERLRREGLTTFRQGVAEQGESLQDANADRERRYAEVANLLKTKDKNVSVLGNLLQAALTGGDKSVADSGADRSRRYKEIESLRKEGNTAAMSQSLFKYFSENSPVSRSSDSTVQDDELERLRRGGDNHIGQLSDAILSALYGNTSDTSRSQQLEKELQEIKERRKFSFGEIGGASQSHYEDDVNRRYKELHDLLERPGHASQMGNELVHRLSGQVVEASAGDRDAIERELLEVRNKRKPTYNEIGGSSPLANEEMKRRYAEIGELKNSGNTALLAELLLSAFTRDNKDSETVMNDYRQEIEDLRRKGQIDMLTQHLENALAGTSHQIIRSLRSELDALRNMTKRGNLGSFDHGPNDYVAQRKESLKAELDEMRRARRKSLAVMASEENNSSTDNLTERQRRELELEALRELRRGTSLSRIHHGDDKRRLQRSNSSCGVTGERTTKLDLDDKTMGDLHVTNSMVKAMFEADAPKYRFGGSGLNKLKLEDQSNRESTATVKVMRPSQKQKEERKWVLGAINRHFDIIKEENEESESCRGDGHSDGDSNDDDDTQKGLEYKSTSNIRALFANVLDNVSSELGESKEMVKEDLKEKLMMRQFSN